MAWQETLFIQYGGYEWPTMLCTSYYVTVHSHAGEKNQSIRETGTRAGAIANVLHLLSIVHVAVLTYENSAEGGGRQGHSSSLYGEL